jgi:hypothetical protein
VRRAVLLAAAWFVAGAAEAHAAPPVARPNPALVGVQLDYVNPLPTLAPLSPRVVAPAIADFRFLAYLRVTDLGGFRPAPVGETFSSGGRTLVGSASRTSEIPRLAQAGGGRVSSFAALGEGFRPPESGRQPVPGLGVPPAVVPPANTNTVPPPNQGFGGRRRKRTAPPTGTTTTRPPPGTTTGTTTTTTTTVPPPTTTTTTTTPPPPPANACGTTGLRITSDHSSCRLFGLTMKPGDSLSEVMTVTNDAGEPFTLSLRASGTQNRLWQDLRFGVWRSGTAPPEPLPPLLWWTTQDNVLASLAPGESIPFVLELQLPSSAGNAVQGLVAVIDLTWKAHS